MDEASTPLIELNPLSGEPLVEQIRQQFTWLIAGGQLQPGDRLPSIRGLAQQLSINLHTVRSAYQRLERDGLVKVTPGAAARVLSPDPRRMADLAGGGRSYTIGVILPDMANPLYHDLLRGVESGLEREKRLLFVCNTHEEPSEYLRCFNQLSARNVDGIIVVSYDLGEMLGGQPSTRLPVVWVDWPGCQGPSLNFDLEGAAWQAVRHLVEHGHRQIGLVTYREDSANVLQMNAGYARALREAGLFLEEALIARVNGFDMASGEAGALQLMSQEEPPQAIFTIADTLALGVLQAFREEGIQVPGQVALASLNDISVAGLLNPGLTTVAFPAQELGRQAVRMLQDLIEGKKPPESQVLLPTRLVIRESCGCRGVARGEKTGIPNGARPIS